MTPRQVLAEVMREYHHNVAGGMSTEQSLEVLKAMLIDLIEYEKDRSFNLGVKSGQFAERQEQMLKSKKKTPVDEQPSPHDYIGGYPN